MEAGTLAGNPAEQNARYRLLAAVRPGLGTREEEPYDGLQMLLEELLPLEKDAGERIQYYLMKLQLS